jgi:hypothetical protein
MPSFFNTWLPFIYLYGVGGIFITIGLIIVKRSGGYNSSIKRHRYWWKISILGFFYFMLIHAALILAALYL